MELNKKAKSLKYILIKYLLIIAGGLVAAIGFSFLLLTFSYKFELIVPANHTENLLIKERPYIKASDYFEESMIPDNTSYILLSENSEIIDSNMDENTKAKALAFHKGEGISTMNLSFMEIKRSEGYVIVSYSLKPYYTNSWIQDHFPPINMLIVGIMVFLCTINTFIITIICAKRVAKQLIPILKASEEIAKQNLDFEIENSNIKEFNLVLNSLEKMKVELSEALRRNWIVEENRRSQISALTHDLKTPLSIIKGNTELLAETNLTAEQQDYIGFITKNAVRISEYADALALMNKSNDYNLDLKKIKISDLVEKIRESATELTLSYQLRFIESIRFEDHFIKADIKQLERVFINILINASKYSPQGSTIELVIVTQGDVLDISVLDQGKGFSSEDLVHGTEQFYQGDKSRHSHTNHGLGLYIAKQIVLIHNGNILLENRMDRSGAKVSVVLPIS